MNQALQEAFPGMSAGIAAAMVVVCAFLVIASLVALVISIFLAIAYIRYNRKENSLSLTGEEIARKILDQYGLEKIKVSATGSILFGNSYSHYFKKVRLRRLTYKKKSVSSMVMAAQKSALAILDKEQDPDMKKRIRLIPLISFGPFACVPLVIIGGLLDYWVFHTDGQYTVVFSIIGVAFYLFSFLLSILVLKTEKKAQTRSLVIMQEELSVTQEDLQMAQKLFRLYNIEYINNMVIALLELIYRILQIVAMFSSNGSSSSSKS